MTDNLVVAREHTIELAVKTLKGLRTEISIDRVLELVAVMDMSNSLLGVRSWNDVRNIINNINFELNKISL